MAVKEEIYPDSAVAHSFEQNELWTYRSGDEGLVQRGAVGRPSPPPSHFGAGDNIGSGGGDGSVMVLFSGKITIIPRAVSAM